jgi:TrmH family RNA methyltransferase
LARICVVLVRPETPANVGATARIVRNTGLDSLRLVQPGDWRTLECWRTAWGAQDVLEQAEVFADLPSALADCAYVAGMSRRREAGAAVLDVRDLAAELAGLAAGQRAALVFGPETHGLTFAELALCGRRARIPTHRAQPSLNLSHAVMVTAYEVFRAGRRREPAARRATHAEKERLLGLLRAGLQSVGALPAVDREGCFREWRALLQRADLTPREARLLEHMARRMQRRGR